SARAQIQFRHRDADQLLRIGAQFTIRFQMPRGHARVAICFCVTRKTLVLFLPAPSNSVPSSGGIFFHAFARYIAVFLCRHLDMEIDSIEKWSRDSLTISLNNDRTAAAFAL